MSAAILLYGVIPPLADLNRTHALHPDWTPHSRVHLVWLVITNSAIALVALYFLWVRTTDLRFSIRLAGVLSLCVLGGFFLAAATRLLYGGALNDPGGVPPIGHVDANL